MDFVLRISKKGVKQNKIDIIYGTNLNAIKIINIII
jgi:hypothetical protein